MRYSASDPQFPVNDQSVFTGKSHAIGGASRPNEPACGAWGKAGSFERKSLRAGCAKTGYGGTPDLVAETGIEGADTELQSVVEGTVQHVDHGV